MQNRRAFRGTGTLLVLGLTGASVSCASLPPRPNTLPQPNPAHVNVAPVTSPLPALERPRALPPRVSYRPAAPEEGTLATLLVEPDPRGLPPLEIRVRVEDRELPLAPVGDGTLLGLIAVPLSAKAIPLRLDITFVDGSRIHVEGALEVAARDFPSTRLSVARRYTAPAQDVIDRILSERDLVRGMLARATPVPLWQGAFVHPRPGTTTSPFGQRRVFNGELRSRHTGLDIRATEGTPVYAANSGRVALARDLYFTGNTVYIDHGLGLYTGYFHLSEIEVARGLWVGKGELIGRVGATGRVTGPHLHWSVSLYGTPLDPLSLLEPVFASLSERMATTPLATGLAAQP